MLETICGADEAVVGTKLTGMPTFYPTDVIVERDVPLSGGVRFGVRSGDLLRGGYGCAVLRQCEGA